MSAYRLLPGYDWNPIRAHRNLPCPCGSKMKAKKCHGKENVLPISECNQIRDYLRLMSMHGFIKARVGEISQKKYPQETQVPTKDAPGPE